MIKKLLIFCILNTTILFGQTEKLNIAVLDLDVTGLKNEDVLFLSNRLRTELFETGKFNVLERDQMNTILEEQGFQQSGCTTIDCAVEIGQLLNVQQMVGGSIGKIEDIYSISLRLIDVQTGAIVKTATKDHSGKLSIMLTDVIPFVAKILATSEDVEKQEDLESTKINESRKEENDGFTISLKGGLSFARYTTELNDLISTYNATIATIDLPEYSNHSNFALEIGYYISKKWELKLGIFSYPQLNEWIYKFDDNRFNRTYNFTNTYFGFNYYFWSVSKKFDLFFGFDIGSFQMNAKTDVYSETQNEFAEKWHNNYETTRFGSKFTLGGAYTIGDFKLGAEFTIRMLGTNFTRTKDPLVSTALFEIVFPKEINAAGTQLSLIVNYDI